MILRAKGAIEALYYRARFGAGIRFANAPIFEARSRINLKNRSLEAGKRLTMKPNAYIAVVNGGKVSLGNSVLLNRGSTIVCHDSVTIGDYCAIAPNVLIYDHDHKFGVEGIKPGFKTAPVVIGRNCWIGAGVTILRGTHIGEGCVIGAGCVVQGEIPPHSLATASRALTIVPIEDRPQTEGSREEITE